MCVLSQELVERTGRNPQYIYQQLGCSKNAVAKMLNYARTQCVGKPFSNVGMARSLLWPRHTDSSSFFCAELVAAILKEGGLMDRTSNPGSATPETLFRIYKDRAAVTANPYVLREMQNAAGLSFPSTLSTPSGSGTPLDRAAEHAAERESLLQQRAIMAPMPAMRPVHHTTASAIGERRRADSPPRGHFKVITHCGAAAAAAAAAAASSSATRLRSHGGPSAHPQCRQVQSTATGGASAAGRAGLQLTLNSLDMSRR